MIAKLVVWGPTRDVAIARTLRALHEYSFEGVRTNLELLKRLLDSARLSARSGTTPHSIEREFGRS